MANANKREYFIPIIFLIKSKHIGLLKILGILYFSYFHFKPGVLVIFGLMIAVFVGLLRRGQTQPVGNDLYAMSVEYRKGAAGFRERVRDNDEVCYYMYF